jgi:hypothetical protein
MNLSRGVLVKFAFWMKSLWGKENSEIQVEEILQKAQYFVQENIACWVWLALALEGRLDHNVTIPAMGSFFMAVWGLKLQNEFPAMDQTMYWTVEPALVDIAGTIEITSS